MNVPQMIHFQSQNLPLPAQTTQKSREPRPQQTRLQKFVQKMFHKHRHDHIIVFPHYDFFILLWEFRLFYYIFGTAHFLEKLKSFERTPKHLQTKYVSELCLFLIQMQQSSSSTIGIPNISFQQTNLFKKHNLPRGSYFIIASQPQEH